MSDLALGRTCRTLRRQLGWRQSDLARKAEVSQTLVSRLERGLAAECTIRIVRNVFAALEADLTISARWRGGELDRLLDEDHSGLVAAIASILRAGGWETLIEVTYSEFGERGSIDVLAWHPSTRTLLVVEVKSIIMSNEETLRRLDVKVRLAPKLGATRFGSRPATVARLLVVGDTSTNRRRVALIMEMGALRSMPKHEVGAWIRRPMGSIATVMFVRRSASAPWGTRRVRTQKMSSPAP